MGLASLPKAFGLSDELAKGHYPYLFNKTERLGMVFEKNATEFPTLEDYGVARMSTDKAAELRKWYKSRPTKLDFSLETHEYCVKDVLILKLSFEKFRRMLFDREIIDIDEVKQKILIDPLSCITIASLCMKIMRTHFIEEDSIPLVSERRTCDVYSKESIEFMCWRSKRDNIYIKHCANQGGKEIVICGYRVDGYCEETKTIYEYHGCLYHGCPHCFGNQWDDSPPPEACDSGFKTYRELYEETVKKSEFLKSKGYKVVECWGHDWVEAKSDKEHTELHQVLWENKLMIKRQGILDPRDAFFGGRTNATVLTALDTKAYYYDFNSMYPSVMFEAEYPYGYPETQDVSKITEANIRADKYFGIMKCLIIAPFDLLHPVLPVRINGKTMFPLCEVCAREQIFKDCIHTEDERAFIGTWTIIEVQKALEKGYRIKAIYNLIHFPKTSYDMWKPFIREFYKYKVAAAGYPSYCDTDEKKLAYRAEFKKRMNTELPEIKENPGLKALSKLCINNPWGKFGQTSQYGETLLVNGFSPDDLEKFQKSFFSPSTDLEKTTWNPIMGSEFITAKFWKKDDWIPTSGNKSLYMAIFTTAHARLKLYDVLDTLKERVLYFDTDSVIFQGDEGHEAFDMGEHLGQLASELNDGDFITDFVSIAPKTYAYRTSKGKETVKVKGFTQDSESAGKLSFEGLGKLLSDVVFEEGGVSTDFANINPPNTEQLLFKREGGGISSTTIKKKLLFGYDKRRLMPDFSTVPWGWSQLYKSEE